MFIITCWFLKLFSFPEAIVYVLEIDCFKPLLATNLYRFIMTGRYCHDSVRCLLDRFDDWYALLVVEVNQHCQCHN